MISKVLIFRGIANGMCSLSDSFTFPGLKQARIDSHDSQAKIHNVRAVEEYVRVNQD